MGPLCTLIYKIIDKSYYTYWIQVRSSGSHLVLRFTFYKTFISMTLFQVGLLLFLIIIQMWKKFWVFFLWKTPNKTWNTCISFLCCIKLRLKEGRVVGVKRWIEIFHYFIQSFPFTFSELAGWWNNWGELTWYLVHQQNEGMTFLNQILFFGVWTQIFWVIKMAHAGKNVNRNDPFIGKGRFFLFYSLQ